MNRARAACMLALGVTCAAPAAARTVRVAPGMLPAAAAAAVTGDTLVLLPGVHAGGVVLATPGLVVRGMPGARIDGGGRGSVVTVSAPGVRLEDMSLGHSGADVMNVDAGVRVLDAPNVHIIRVRIDDVLYGVAADRAVGIEVRDCALQGRVTARGDAVDDRMDGTGSGNGLHLWSTPDAVLAGNHVRHFQDAIYLSFCDRTVARSNRIEDNGRYGFHTMYCQSTRIVGDQFRRNVAGCAIMFSNHLEVHDNVFEHNRGSRTYGLLLRDCSDGMFQHNTLLDNTIALFMDGSNRNRIENNLVQDNGWGLLLYGSCAGNVYTGNAFVNDDYPVALDMKYTDNQFDDGRRGNYWSENSAYDLNGDGVSDVPWSPVTTFAFVSKQYPDLTVLAKSPAVAALGVAERVFPSLRPSEAVDRFPLVAAPATRTTGGATRGDARRRGWFGVAGFGALFGAGLFGVVRHAAPRARRAVRPR